jgi:hypothetical protein
MTASSSTARSDQQRVCAEAISRGQDGGSPGPRSPHQGIIWLPPEYFASPALARSGVCPSHLLLKILGESYTDTFEAMITK